MAALSKGEFFRLLKKSRLLETADRVEAKRYCQGMADAASAAAELTRRGLLTAWQAAQLLRGRTHFFLGKYKLLKFRGRGAMGVVFKAEHPEMRRTVAIKVLSKTLLDKQRSVSRFLREIRSTAVLNHPNLVVAYDADQVDGTYCLVMEYISGRSLKALCEEHGRLPVLWSCECIRQAALALKHIHERGLVHRDVKPSNLLITISPGDNRPQVKLLDIGLARFVSETEEEGSLTREGQIVGTGDYMAPEQVAKAKEADIRADIYGLGATLFQMLTGSPPLTAGTLLQTYINRLQREPPLVSTLNEGIPAGLDQVVAKMLKANPQDRYQSPNELVADLASILAGLLPETAMAAPTSITTGPQIPEAIAFPGPFGAEHLLGQSAGAESAEGTDTIAQFFSALSGSTAEGTSSSDVSNDATASEFLDWMESGSAEDMPTAPRPKRNSAKSDRLSTISEQASRAIRSLLDRVPGLSTSPGLDESAQASATDESAKRLPKRRSRKVRVDQPE